MIFLNEIQKGKKNYVYSKIMKEENKEKKKAKKDKQYKQ